MMIFLEKEKQAVKRDVTIVFSKPHPISKRAIQEHHLHAEARNSGWKIKLLASCVWKV